MLSKRMAARFGIPITAAITAVTVLAAPAQATDHSFSVTYFHSTGAAAVTFSGDVTWLNRSVIMSNLKLFVRGGECGRGAFAPIAERTDLQVRTTAQYCPTATSTASLNDITLDGSAHPGGITQVGIEAKDETHDGWESGAVFR